jgi:hypothetical protein
MIQQPKSETERKEFAHLEFTLRYCIDRLNAAPDDPAVADVANKLAALKNYVSECVASDSTAEHERVMRSIESGCMRIR